jgi:DNA-binding GntR family transcriptional regulator
VTESQRYRGCKTDHVPDQQRREPVPPYRRIAADLREKIKSMQPGEQIPSATEICETYGVARNTALRAIKLLRDEDLITVEQGWGSFVK